MRWDSSVNVQTRWAKGNPEDDWISSSSSLSSVMPALRPQRLRRGDVIGVVAPAGPIPDPARIDAGVRYLERMGYRVLPGKHIHQVAGYLAGNDRERIDDLHAMFRNKHVRAIFCLRGGYGSPRLLSRLDYQLIRKHPKLLVGYSDITALQLALWKKCRLVTFHGPMVVSDMAGVIDPLTEESFWPLVTEPGKHELLQRQSMPRHDALRPGRARGIILGGNLSLIAALMGTPFLPSFRASLLALEEIGEEPYRIDRMLNQLSQAGILPSARAILCGQFTDCGPKDTSHPSASVNEILEQHSAALRKPFLTNLPFGHVSAKVTLPFGVSAIVDAASGSIRLLENAIG
jgi:muramoyltetrapeptide carboxypeptidase